MDGTDSKHFDNTTTTSTPNLTVSGENFIFPPFLSSAVIITKMLNYLIKTYNYLKLVQEIK